MPLIAMVDFGDERTTKNSLRFDANVTAIHGNALDYDNNDGQDFPFEKAMEILDDNNIRALGYTSPSHTSEHPRWRILLPYRETIEASPETLKHIHKGGVLLMEEMLGLQFAPESKRLSQSYYIGQAETADSYHWHKTTGEAYIDDLDNLAATGYLAGGNGHDTSDDKLDTKVAIDNIGLGEDLHENLLRLTAHYAKYNLPRAEIIQLVQKYMEDSEAPNDARYQQRYDSIPRLTDGALRKLKSGEWETIDPNTQPAKSKTKPKKKSDRVVTISSMRELYCVTTEDLAEIDATDYIYKEIFRGPQMIAIAGPPSAGKTTIMEHVASEMSETHEIMYINADISSGDIPAAHKRAQQGGYSLLCPDIKVGKSMTDVVEDVTALTEQGTDLTGYVFIFDTLKKMTDMINKSVSKDLYKMLRQLTTICHATVICLAHCNKYDHDGWPQYEGTGDLRSDFDSLGLLFPLKGDYGQITASLYWGQDDALPWGKTRGRVDHAAWSMDTNDEGERVVGQVKWIDTYALAKDAAAVKQMEDVNIAIANVIYNWDGGPNVSEVCSKSGHPMRITRKALGAGMGKFWTVEVGEHNSKSHYLTESGRELIDAGSAEDDFSDLLN